MELKILSNFKLKMLSIFFNFSIAILVYIAFVHLNDNYFKDYYNKRELMEIEKNIYHKSVKIIDKSFFLKVIAFHADDGNWYQVTKTCNDKIYCDRLYNNIKIGYTYNIRYTDVIVGYENGIMRPYNIYGNGWFPDSFITYLDKDGEVLIDKKYISF